MRPGDLRPPPVTARAKGQVREGLRYVRSVPELWVPLVMMAVIGTLAFNFTRSCPLFVTRDLGGSDRPVHPPVLGDQRRVARRGAGRGPAPTGRRPRPSGCRPSPSACSMVVLAVAPSLGLAFPIGVARRPGQHRVPDRLDGHRADCGPRPRCGAGCWPCRPWSSWAARRSADRSWAGCAQTAGARWALVLGAVACLGAGAWGLVVVRRHPGTERLVPVPTGTGPGPERPGPPVPESVGPGPTPGPAPAPVAPRRGLNPADATPDSSGRPGPRGRNAPACGPVGGVDEESAIASSLSASSDDEPQHPEQHPT